MAVTRGVSYRPSQRRRLRRASGVGLRSAQISRTSRTVPFYDFHASGPFRWAPLGLVGLAPHLPSRRMVYRRGGDRLRTEKLVASGRAVIRTRLILKINPITAHERQSLLHTVTHGYTGALKKAFTWPCQIKTRTLSWGLVIQ
jgi:hypothetical protein